MIPKYCGDCVFYRIKRGKGGNATGEHICIKWNSLKSEWGDAGVCSYFLDKADVEVKDDT